MFLEKKIIRTWHLDKEGKDYLGGPSKYFGFYMKEMIFQDDKYFKTVIRYNPFHIMEIYSEKLLSLTHKELENRCEENNKNSNWEILKEYYENPDEEFLSILEGYKKSSSKITLDKGPNGSITKGRLIVPINIARKLDYRTGNCKVYYDEERGDVFIHFNTKKSVNYGK
ncbi:hypothetical protein [Methanobrevibacter arboriphilus]|uniref:hypothetical protein n=1 Tax=Methanobrevibacter arboriphilus TaxID=39441 RepID=UPI000ADC6B09|nr:hypothetical protein [Methanobrevibacter arboriphilus]